MYGYVDYIIQIARDLGKFNTSFYETIREMTNICTHVMFNLAFKQDCIIL